MTLSLPLKCETVENSVFPPNTPNTVSSGYIMFYQLVDFMSSCCPVLYRTCFFFFSYDIRGIKHSMGFYCFFFLPPAPKHHDWLCCIPYTLLHSKPHHRSLIIMISLLHLRFVLNQESYMGVAFYVLMKPRSRVLGSFPFHFFLANTFVMEHRE